MRSLIRVFKWRGSIKIWHVVHQEPLKTRSPWAGTDENVGEKRRSELPQNHCKFSVPITTHWALSDESALNLSSGYHIEEESGWIDSFSTESLDRGSVWKSIRNKKTHLTRSKTDLANISTSSVRYPTEFRWSHNTDDDSIEATSSMSKIQETNRSLFHGPHEVYIHKREIRLIALLVSELLAPSISLSLSLYVGLARWPTLQCTWDSGAL